MPGSSEELRLSASTQYLPFSFKMGHWILVFQYTKNKKKKNA